MKIADLFAEVGFKFDSIKLREVNKLIGDLNISSIVGATSLAGLGVEIKNLIESSSQLSSNLQTITANTGIDSKFTQQFEDAAYALGSSKESADSFLTSLSQLQTKIMTNQGGQQFFQVANILGVDPASFKKIMGDTEGLAKYVQETLSKPVNTSDHAAMERVARIKSWLGSMVGASPDMVKALGNPDFFKEMLKFETLSKTEINQNFEATKAWREAVINVNMEFIRLADKLLPALTNALNTFVNNSGFKKISDTFQGIEDFFERMGIVKTYAQATLMNIASAASQPLINAARLGNEVRKDFSKSVSVTTGPIIVQANDPQEFVKRFDEALVKKYMNADLNFSAGQT